MTGLNGYRLTVGLRAQAVNLPVGGSATAKAPVRAAAAQALAYGTAATQADLVVTQVRTLAAGASETFDLYAGTALTDVFGDPAPFRKVRTLMVWVESGGDAAGLAVGGAATNAWIGFFADKTDKAKVFPSGPPYLGGSPAGVAVASTADLNLKVENLGAVAVTYGIVVAGSTA